MQTCLYMICPTDYLEVIVDNRFSGHKHFYSSLGNTFSMDDRTLGYISGLIKNKDINEIFIMLSEENRIVHDALKNQRYMGIRGLDESYHEFLEHNKHAVRSWKAGDYHNLILSYHLNEKVIELSESLDGLLSKQPIIRGKLFSKVKNEFINIHSNLICAPINLN